MSCLCQNTCNLEITNQLESLAATIAKVETCLADIAAKLALIDGYDEDWDGSDEEEDEDQ